MDTDWFSLTDKAGAGVRVDAVKPVAFSARLEHDAMLAAATTTAELAAALDASGRKTVEVHIDAAIRGLGTGACGPDTLSDYRVSSGIHEWSWFLRRPSI